MSEGLDALALAGDQLGAGDQAEGGPQPAPGPPPVSPNVAALTMTFTAFRELSCKLLEVDSPRRTLDDHSIANVVGVLAPLADKYGWNLDLSEWGVEVGAALVAAPILWNACMQLNHELKAKKAKPVDQAQAANEPSSSSSSSDAAAA